MPLVVEIFTPPAVVVVLRLLKSDDRRRCSGITVGETDGLTLNSWLFLRCSLVETAAV